MAQKLLDGNLGLVHLHSRDGAVTKQCREQEMTGLVYSLTEKASCVVQAAGSRGPGGAGAGAAAQHYFLVGAPHGTGYSSTNGSDVQRLWPAVDNNFWRAQQSRNLSRVAGYQRQCDLGILLAFGIVMLVFGRKAGAAESNDKKSHESLLNVAARGTE
jgi:hypothetical protein